MQNSENAVEVKNLHKSFRLPHEQHSGIKQLLLNLFSRKYKKGYETQYVLKGVEFEIKKGEFFGIVGRNGSGKSTLLKLLAGIYTPDKGSVTINGTLVPFIELGVGFNPELTGRENVFLNGALLGFSHSEMEVMYDEIVEFAELEQFMDQKLKNYSSGMQVRLAFSIAIRAKSDILVLDEVLAVGDEAFQRKCYQYFAKLKRDKKTVILVTHSMDNIIQFCTRAMLIDKGHETTIGKPLKIAQIYRELNYENESLEEKPASKREGRAESKYIEANAEFKVSDGRVKLTMNLHSKKQVNDPVVAVGIYKDTGEQVYRWTSDEKAQHYIDLNKLSKIDIVLNDIFPVGIFTATIFIKKRDRTIDYAVFNDIAQFESKNLSPYEYDTYWKIPEKTYVNGEEVQ